MGNKSETGTVKDERLNFQFSHPRFKNADFKKDLSRETIVTRIPVNNQKQYEDWVEKVKNSPGAAQEGVLSPVKNDFQKGGLCGSSGNVTAEYENYPFILTEEIKNRQQAEHRVFEQNQLWYLIYTFADVGSKFHNRGSKVGDIRPTNVFINEDGQLKVATKHSWPQEMDNYQKAFYEKQKTYLAPEEIKDLQIGRSQTVADADSAESFSAGLTVLDAALLQNSQNIYTNNGNIDYETLLGKKQNLKNDAFYGDLLKHTILTMLENNPENRIKLNELNSWLQPYSSQIINLQPFHAQVLNQKIRKTAEENPISHRVERPKQVSYPANQTIESQVVNGYPHKSELVLKSNQISSNEGNEVKKLESGAPQTHQPPIVQNQPPLPIQRQTMPVVYSQSPPHSANTFHSGPPISSTNNFPKKIIMEPIRQPPPHISSEPRQQLRRSVEKSPPTFVDPRNIQGRKAHDPLQTQLRQSQPKRYYDPMRPNIVENPRQTVTEIPRPILNEPPRRIVQVLPPMRTYPLELPPNTSEIPRQTIPSPRTVIPQPPLRSEQVIIGEPLNYNPHQEIPRHEIRREVRQVSHENKSNPFHRLEDRIYEAEGIQPNYHFSETFNRFNNGEEKKQQVYRKFAEGILPDGNNQKTVKKTVEEQNYVNPEGITHMVKTETVTRTQRTEKIDYESKPENRDESVKGSFSSDRGKSSLRLIEEKIANSRRMYPSQ